jgi:hypothetical protein
MVSAESMLETATEHWRTRDREGMPGFLRRGQIERRRWFRRRVETPGGFADQREFSRIFQRILGGLQLRAASVSEP